MKQPKQTTMRPSSSRPGRECRRIQPLPSEPTTSPADSAEYMAPTAAGAPSNRASTNAGNSTNDPPPTIPTTPASITPRTTGSRTTNRAPVASARSGLSGAESSSGSGAPDRPPCPGDGLTSSNTHVSSAAAAPAP